MKDMKNVERFKTGPHGTLHLPFMTLMLFMVIASRLLASFACLARAGERGVAQGQKDR
jgi:hypothetical protein